MLPAAVRAALVVFVVAWIFGPYALRSAVPVLFGTVLSVCTAYAVVLLMATGHLLGRQMALGEAVAVTVLILLAFVRTLLWAADGHRLARRLVRAEAYFRALVNSADDVTVVLDGDGAVTWVSGAARAQLGWSQQELTGQVLNRDPGFYVPMFMAAAALYPISLAVLHMLTPRLQPAPVEGVAEKGGL